MENISEVNLVDCSNILYIVFDDISFLEDLRKILKGNFYNEVSFVSIVLVI